MKKNSDISKSSETLNIDVPLPRVSSIKDRINELELQVSSTSDKLTKSEVKSPTSQSRSGFVFNLANQFELGSKPSSPVDEGLVMKPTCDEEIVEPVISQTKPPAYKHHAVLVKPSLWPEESTTSLDPSCINENKLLSPNNNSDPKDKILSSDISSVNKEQIDESSCDTSLAQRLHPVEGNMLKTSQSAFKPFEANTDSQSRGPLDERLSQFQQNSSNCCQTMRFLIPNEQKTFEKSLCNFNIDRNIKTSSTNLMDLNKVTDPLLPVKGSAKFQNITCLMSNSKPPVKLSSVSNISPNEFLNVQSKPNYFYDKEDIPFIPGTVRRTKQKIEEKNLTRTTSFDSGFPFQTRSTPSTPPEAVLGAGKLIRRSHSLRNDCRPIIPFYGKWYPLPALATTVPQSFKTLTDNTLQCADNISMMHSVSTPSVVEAVNRVICGTQEILSAIHFMPPEKKVSSTRSSSDSDFDFGSASSLPDIDARDLAFINKSPPIQSDIPVPGLVRQQREILENKATKISKEKCNTELCKARKDACKLLPSELGSNLVVSDASKHEDIKESGIVKRLKKELEAKSELCKKDKNVLTGFSEMEDLEQHGGKLLTTGLLPVEKQICSYSEPYADQMSRLGSLSSSLENKGTLDEQKAPPTPHRKTSLDLSFMQKRFPLNIKLGSQPSIPPIKPNSRTVYTTDSKNLYERTVEFKPTSDLLQSSAKSKSVCVTKIPPPPPPPPPPVGLPRKMRKQQGSTHPLSKLIRQRHPNPLYNTM
ncbi:hypothetical protein X975_21557, partial [Stegodyphus mimosarum]